MSTTRERAPLGYLLDENQGEAFWLFGMHETIKIGSKDTGGQYGLLEIVVPAGLGSPWHVHPEEDEWFYVLEGEITFWVADTRLSLKPGSFAFGPKGVPHTFYAEASGAKALVGFAPMHFEGFLREVGQPALSRVAPPPSEGKADMARLVPIGKRNGLEILGPPGPPPGR
jgi:quercetin dioxygenase-like cupin family protein